MGHTTEGDILRNKEKWMSHERSGRAAKYGKLEKALIIMELYIQNNKIMQLYF